MGVSFRAGKDRSYSRRAQSVGEETKNPSRIEGPHALGCSGLSRIVPASGLALAPWRLDQVAVRVVGPEPSTPLLILWFLNNTGPSCRSILQKYYRNRLTRDEF